MKILDNRGLEPPQPMMRTLKNLDQMTDGEKIMPSLMIAVPCFCMKSWMNVDTSMKLKHKVMGALKSPLRKSVSKHVWHQV